MSVALERRPLVVQRDARPLLERELAAVLLGLAGEDPQQRRLAGAVRAGERDAVAPLDAERDAVEERRCRANSLRRFEAMTTAIAPG